MDEYLGIIKLFAGNYAPQNYMFCAGQMLPVNDYKALFSVLGTFYGGDGVTNFKLPDLRSRVAIGVGQGAGLSSYNLGRIGGNETIQLTQAQLPSHSHGAVFTPTGGGAGNPITASVTVNAGTAGTTTNDPTGAYWGSGASIGLTQTRPYTNTKSVTMASDAVQISITGGGGGITGGNVAVANAGAGMPFSSIPPYLALNYIICINGLYPPRS
jgi:microcystin-dependent protein